MAAAIDVIMLQWLPWKPIKQQVILIKWKYKEHSLYVPKYPVNRMNGVKSRGEGSDWPPPPPPMSSCNSFYRMPSRANDTKLYFHLIFLRIAIIKNGRKIINIAVLSRLKNCFC